MVWFSSIVCNSSMGRSINSSSASSTGQTPLQNDTLGTLSFSFPSMAMQQVWFVVSYHQPIREAITPPRTYHETNPNWPQTLPFINVKMYLKTQLSYTTTKVHLASLTYIHTNLTRNLMSFQLQQSQSACAPLAWTKHIFVQVS